MKPITLSTTILMVFCLASCASEQSQKTDANDVQPVVWTAGADVEDFWSAYIESKGGLTWGRSAEYPDYDQVKEGDTFMVEVEQGPCLMEFFHNRWRRANDVWRWDDSVNEFGGCPYVFD